MHLTFRRHISPYTWFIRRMITTEVLRRHTHNCISRCICLHFSQDFYMMYGLLKSGFHAPSIQWNLTTAQPYPPSSKSKQPDDWEKGDFSPCSKGQYGRKRVVWGKSTRSRYYIKLRCHFLCRIGDNKGWGHSVPAAAASVSADDRRMGEGAPRDALFVTYPPHLPHPPT